MKTQLIDHLEKVQYFQIVAESGSIQEGAKRIGIAQPALSKSIKILEKACQCLLLERSRKGVSLTDDGQALLNFSYAIGDLLVGLEDQLSNINANKITHIKIGMHELYVPFLWSKIIKTIEVRFPKMELDLTTDVLSQNLLELLEQRKLDLVIAVDRKASRSIEKSALYTDRYAFYKSFQSKRTVKKSEKLIYLPYSKVTKEMNLEQLLKKNHYNDQPIYNISTYASILSLIVSDAGIGVLPEKPSEFYIDKKLITKITEQRLNQSQHKVCIYTRSSSIQNRKIDSLKEHIKNLF